MENNNNFTPSTSWMTAKYAEMNSQLFNDELGECDFGIFTKGRGSQGGVLGWFRITGRVKAAQFNRRMFKVNPYGERIWVDSKNFVDICRPRIELNGNYRGTEEAFLATLVHEMCHYHNYKDGYIPKQGHGTEFRHIAAIVSSRSNGRFTVQRVATAEQMSGLELNDEMKQKKEKRAENKKHAVTAVFRFMNDGSVQLTTTSNQELIDALMATYKNCKKVVTSNDYDLITILFQQGYKRNFRTWRYWNVEGKDFVNNLNQYQTSTLEDVVKKEKKIFLLRTSNGIKEIDYGGSKFKLYSIIKSMIPKINDDSLWNLIDNKANYKTVTESKINTSRIIREVIEDFIKEDEKDGVIDILPNMNLGLYSPMEIEN